MEKGVTPILNVTSYHKHTEPDRYDCYYSNDYDDGLVCECQVRIKDSDYIVDMTSKDLVKNEISNAEDLLKFLSLLGYDVDSVEKLHILVITSNEVMKEMAEKFSVFEYWKVLSVLSKS